MPTGSAAAPELPWLPNPPVKSASGVASVVDRRIADSDEVGRVFRFEAGHHSDPEVGQCSDLISAIWLASRVFE